MKFGALQFLHLLWLVPVLAGILHLFFMRREKITARFIQNDLLPKNIKASNVKLWRRRAAFLTMGYIFSVLALARPQWGYQWQDVKQQGLDILIAIDVSKSMLTKDVRPSRLERTKLAVKDLVKKLNGDRIGLIAFAGEAFLVCPLTNDYSGFLLSLNDLNMDTIPRGGTNLSKSIEEAIKGYGDRGQKFKTLVLVTDGEDNEGDALKTAQKAKDKGIRIYTVGIGTQEGDLIQVTNEQGQKEFLKDANGNFVKSRLNEKLLQQIAYNTAGAYVRSSGSQFGLDYLYERQLSKLEKTDIDQKQQKKYHERFQWFLSAALAAFFYSSF
jgi:Ca-activated chloride channel homolog